MFPGNLLDGFHSINKHPWIIWSLIIKVIVKANTSGPLFQKDLKAGFTITPSIVQNSLIFLIDNLSIKWTCGLKNEDLTGDVHRFCEPTKYTKFSESVGSFRKINGQLTNERT